MGQKVNPLGFRLGIIKTWSSKWFAQKGYASLLLEDKSIRDYIKKKLYHAGISKIEIERKAIQQRLSVLIYTARPGIIIGRKGTEIEKIKEELQKLTGKQVYINIMEVKSPETDAQLVAENVALQLERRIAFRRAMKQAVSDALHSGALGVKINCAGRLGGSEIARTEWYREGRIPLHTLRADIDYGFAESHTTYGKIGIKAWIFKGEIIPSPKSGKTEEGVQKNADAQKSEIP
ncbi:30S ribosomal protein S3 [Candidatus Desantisbacteria bacterium CG_4_10_14_0_8_um_filter_48_22]|uniref:Small ribosomal subunit protein uS3 n=1 Tax=Candidatus Desantisbacteria bacterium CG_4_10_14_0_8_um_filter_48_22 TaxID=1974543 RepID=A0A2M7S9F5_9BACT|nr:ribosomal protein S3 [uncultured bacterium]OIO03466.1 MAG: 30S ribosomal protein S3 [Candidatus Desantisbacteria bacterium CG1_02_49_89]PIV54676.1 MAG: 30S ribosomal protein S3 [Candidatus Desantisbacteria bacterium CG02_land_8_20_14_3_00_49_13]PIZ16176.1 MAG: 30S ribosomal protein S3 [Candidatus Desantisbacteria bacterium CG_4_10_14_0_8_um_filter_48_22]PJB27615.1 MAG: 30S ribosomal protein S3 [Candidatus Desantisbacteria bacterium CG_4_9_14_3_um_filter_50_7]